ncbi:transthyretin-like family protein [Sulfuricaulis sp.]
MNSFHLNKFLFVFLFVLWLPLTACAVSGDAIDGQVMKEGTNKPIPGAIVVVRWQGNAGGPVDSSTICYHVETATTDEQGRFHIKAWKTTEEAVGLHTTWYQRLFMGPTIFDREVMTTAYRPGYTFSTKPSEKNTVWLKPFTGTREERFKDLVRVSTSCGSAGESERNLLPLIKALYAEASSIATTAKEKEITDNILMSSEAIEFGWKEAEKRAEERQQRSRGQQ